MSLFARLVRLLRANLHGLLARLPALGRTDPTGPTEPPPPAADDPLAALKQAIASMSARLLEGRKAVALAADDQKHLAERAEQESAHAAEWERRAVLAVERGDESLANECLLRKKQHAARAAGYEEERGAHEAKTERLETSLRELDGELAAVKRRYASLRARARAALRALTPLEACFDAAGRRYRAVGGGGFVLEPRSPRGRPVEVRLGPGGAVAFSAAIGLVPGGEAGRRLALRLLETNASALSHCAYGVRDGVIIVASTRALSELGPNEVEAILTDFDLAVARHERDLAPAPSARSNLERRALLSWEFLPASRSSSRRTSMT